MERKGRILIIDDDSSIQRSYEKFAVMEGYDALTAKDGLDGYQKIKTFEPDLVFLDINMPEMNGLELLEKLQKEKFSSLPIIIAITAYGDMDAAVKAINMGAYDFLTKPIPLEKLRLSIKRSFEKIMMQEKLAFLVTEKDYTPDKLVGRSSQMIEIYKNIAMLSKNKATVLITGESGTGKEVAARVIHDISSNGLPFIPINCAAIPENLIESEIMGYVKGSFTGADKDMPGKLAAVGKGTLLLDEISELPYEFQAKLLRVLQEREYFPIGSSAPKIFEGRIIAATNRNLENLVKENLFRQDLFYRLNVISINLPPLRERIEDIELLAKHFICKVNHQMETKIEGMTRECLDFLKKHDWPGNVRELENTIIRAAISTKDSIISRDSIELSARAEKRENIDKISENSLFSMMLPLKDVEKKYIKYVLDSTDWQKVKTSNILGITRPTLDKKIEEYGLKHV